MLSCIWPCFLGSSPEGVDDLCIHLWGIFFSSVRPYVRTSVRPPQAQGGLIQALGRPDPGLGRLDPGSGRPNPSPGRPKPCPEILPRPNARINAVDHQKCLYEAHIKVFINGLNKALYKRPKCLYKAHIKLFINSLIKAIYKRPKLAIS